ncbi:MAG: hypothetical protein RL522_3031 [Pseudomonadota bacterium]|jgi:hypothetical protein
MPSTGLSNVAVLGDSTEYSRQMFAQLFKHPEHMPKFKRFVSTSADRWKYRLGAKQASVSESARMVFSAKTNYNVVLRQLIAEEDKGSLAHIANFRFMINASHAAVSTLANGSLRCLSSPQSLRTPADYLHQPLHRLLIEEHVYAFVWSPQYSKTYHAVRAAVAVARLASSVASTVTSLGASAPALIESLQAAAKVTQDLIKLKTAVGSSVSTLLQMKEEVGGMLDDLSDAREKVAALHGSSAAVSDALVGSASSGSLDLASRSVASAPQSVKVWRGLLGSRQETDQERLARIGKELETLEKEIQGLNFVVVQHITPVIQLRDNVDIASPTDMVMQFNFKTYLAKRALVRVGETNRDRFNQMVAADKTDSLGANGIAEVLCHPWPAEGVFLQYLRQPKDESLEPRTYPQSSSLAFVHWDDLSKPEWELADERRDTMPLPESILKARAAMQAHMREAQRQATAAAVTRDQTLMRWGHRAKGTIADAQKERLRRINDALRISRIPTIEQFKAETTTTTAGFTNSRVNPRLLVIDLALMTWETAKQQSSVSLGIEQMVAALKSVVMACEDYLVEKQKAAQSFWRRSSQRMAPVNRLRQEAIRVLDVLQRERGRTD